MYFIAHFVGCFEIRMKFHKWEYHICVSSSLLEIARHEIELAHQYLSDTVFVKLQIYESGLYKFTTSCHTETIECEACDDHCDCIIYEIQDVGDQNWCVPS